MIMVGLCPLGWRYFEGATQSNVLSSMYNKDKLMDIFSSVGYTRARINIAIVILYTAAIHKMSIFVSNNTLHVLLLSSILESDNLTSFKIGS